MLQRTQVLMTSHPLVLFYTYTFTFYMKQNLSIPWFIMFWNCWRSCFLTMEFTHQLIAILISKERNGCIRSHLAFNNFLMYRTVLLKLEVIKRIEPNRTGDKCYSCGLHNLGMTCHWWGWYRYTWIDIDIFLFSTYYTRNYDSCVYEASYRCKYLVYPRRDSSKDCLCWAQFSTMNLLISTPSNHDNN